MLYRSMLTAASGMDAFIFNLDTIANNLANAGTTAFKRSRTNFEDQFYQYYKVPGAQDVQGNQMPEGIYAGTGVRISAVQPDFTQGSLVTTGRQFDIAIAGDGFFEVTDGGPVQYYTRNGQFTVNANGQLMVATANRGLLLNPPITIPQDTVQVSIDSTGIVSVLQAGSNTLQQVGTILLNKFLNPEGLLMEGDTLYTYTDASGVPQPYQPGTNGVGTLRQNYLEASNTEPVRELVDLIRTQRNVELNSQVVQASDQLLQLVSNLRRF